jgi:hypothetical protein
MGRLIVNAASLAVAVAMSGSCVAMPMYAEAAAKLPRAEQLAAQARAGKPPSATEHAELVAFLKMRDSVITSAAAWILSRDISNRDENLKALAEIEADTYGLMAAFVKLAQVQLSEIDERRRLARLREFTTSDNPYLQVEATRQISTSDPKAAFEIFRRLAQDSANPARREIAEQLKRMDPGAQVAPAVPPTDDMYAIVLDVIRTPEVLAAHSLLGQTVQGEIGPPFPSAVDKLTFTWRLEADAGAEPVEIRWIAGDVGEVATLQAKHRILIRKKGNSC